jgi:hypothetical protein
LVSASEANSEGSEREWVEQLVLHRVIDNWEAMDEPEHLRTIRDQLCRCPEGNRLISSQRLRQLLFLYRQILAIGEIKAASAMPISVQCVTISNAPVFASFSPLFRPFLLYQFDTIG